jgi:16S rRNA G966 N2-methylase RsmD
VENTLYYGDNLDILRRYVKDETVDLVYLDPPFKSNQDCNVLDRRGICLHMPGRRELVARLFVPERGT